MITKTRILKSDVKSLINRFIPRYNQLYEEFLDKVVITNKPISKTYLDSIEFSSHFVPLEIQSIIRSKIKTCFSTSIVENDVILKVKWFSTSNSNKQELKVTEDIIKALVTIKLLEPYSNCQLSNKELELRMFDLDIAKFFPEQGDTISPINVNSAYTIPCRYEDKSLSITIFRREEWQKVLIHELIHLYSLDMIDDAKYVSNSLTKIFNNLECNFNLTEAYCEFWARTLACVISSKGDVEIALQYLIEQQMWSIHQAILVLNNMSIAISYDGLISLSDNQKQKQCNETTSAFAYYVITGFLMTGWTTIYRWCKINNRNLLGFDNYNNVKLEEFISVLDKIVNSKEIRSLWLIMADMILTDSKKMNKQTAKMTSITY